MPSTFTPRPWRMPKQTRVVTGCMASFRRRRKRRAPARRRNALSLSGARAGAKPLRSTAFAAAHDLVHDAVDAPALLLAFALGALVSLRPPDARGDGERYEQHWTGT